MIEVALEASGRPGSVAARRGEELLEVTLSEDSFHASDLLGALDGLIHDLGGSPTEISAVLVGTGPGSFTGLRVAIATAMGMVRGTRAVMRGVPSFEALLFETLERDQEAHVVLDARSSELYVARYRRVESDVITLVAPRVVPAGPLDIPTEERIFGDEPGLKAAGLQDRTDKVTLVSSDGAPSARNILNLGALRLAELGPEAPKTVEPLYLRPYAARKRRR